MSSIVIGLDDAGAKVRVPAQDLAEVADFMKDEAAQQKISSIVDRGDEVRHWVVRDEAPAMVAALDWMRSSGHPLSDEQLELRDYLATAA